MEGLAALLEMTLIFGLVIAFGLWEIWRLRRDRRAEKDEDVGR